MSDMITNAIVKQFRSISITISRFEKTNRLIELSINDISSPLFTFSLYRYILLISVFIGGNSLINAIGLVFILTNKHEKRKKVYLNEKFALIDIIDSKEVIDDEGTH